MPVVNQHVFYVIVFLSKWHKEQQDACVKCKCNVKCVRPSLSAERRKP